MKRRRIIFIFLAVLLAGLLVFCFIGPAEPTYKGRTLTSYLRGPWLQTDDTEKENPHFAPDIAAIRAIGTNGIPTLLRLISAHDPPWKAKAISWLNGQKLVRLEILSAREKRQLGFLGFHILDELGSPAAPQLVKLLENSHVEVRMFVADVLLHMPAGKEAHLAAIKCLLMDSELRHVGIPLIDVFTRRFPTEAQLPDFRKLFDGTTNRPPSPGDGD